jgi:RNA polymerase sigma factor (sigma-70 family)
VQIGGEGGGSGCRCPSVARVRRPSAHFGDAFPALLSAAQSGAAWAWQRLYEWLAPVVAGYLRVQGVHDVDDVTSEVFLGMVRGIDTFTGDESGFRSWVFVIAHRRLQDERRRAGRRPPPELHGDVLPAGVDGDHGGDAEDDALRGLATARVHTLCERLAPDQRDVVLLRIVGDLTVDDVAAVLGKSPGAVKQLQRRGFGALRRMLEQEGVPL